MTGIAEEKSAIILAGGFSKRLGKDKGLTKLANKPLIVHVINRISAVVDEVAVIVGSNGQKNDYSHSLKSKAKIVIDEYEIQSPLVGALTGFENVQGKYSLLLPCDTPFISNQIASLLLELCYNKEAVIPRWPNGYLEPLQAAYNTESALTAANKALKNGKLNMRSMLRYLGNISYISTSVLKRIDPELMTFFNINTLADLKKAERLFHGSTNMKNRFDRVSVI